MNKNFIDEVLAEQEFFISKFMEIGWAFDDESLCKNTGFVVNPSAANEHWKYSIGLSFSPAFLSYTRGGKGKPVEDVLEVWIKGTVGVEFRAGEENKGDNALRLNAVAQFVKQEIEKTGHKAFYDEDAFFGFFSKQVKENLQRTFISFYVNKDYPDGWWQNHTL